MHSRSIALVLKAAIGISLITKKNFHFCKNCYNISVALFCSANGMAEILDNAWNQCYHPRHLLSSKYLHSRKMIESYVLALVWDRWGQTFRLIAQLVLDLVGQGSLLDSHSEMRSDQNLPGGHLEMTRCPLGKRAGCLVLVRWGSAQIDYFQVSAT